MLLFLVWAISFIISWILTIGKQKLKWSSGERNALSLKEMLSLSFLWLIKIPIRHPPDSGDIHFPLIVFNYLLPLETASSHSSSLAAVTLKETPNQNICLSFSRRSDRWMRADTRGRCICPNQGLISVSPPGECFISTGHWWIRHLALIWRSGSPLPKCQVKSQRQWLSHGHYRHTGNTDILPLP